MVLVPLMIGSWVKIKDKPDFFYVDHIVNELRDGKIENKCVVFSIKGFEGYFFEDDLKFVGKIGGDIISQEFREDCVVQLSRW